MEKQEQKKDIVDIIGEHVDLKEMKKSIYRNSFHIGLCPFHKEKTPSLMVVRASQKFHCFGCGSEGDAKDFIEKLNNKS
jgi:DNA primase